MSNAIRFLEALGGQPADAAAADAYEAAVASLELGEPQRQALRGRDAGALARLLDGRATMFCMICTPDDGAEHQAVPDEGGTDDDMVPDDGQDEARD